jgi:hypothetical protein
MTNTIDNQEELDRLMDEFLNEIEGVGLEDNGYYISWYREGWREKFMALLQRSNLYS